MSAEQIPEFGVAHLDADAFYVSIELRRHPELKGKPVVVAGSGPRAVVTTASYEARRFGVGSAMPAAKARRLCPEAIVLPPDFPTYREVSRQVMDLVRAHVERVEVVGLDEAYLDLTGLYSPRAAMRRLLAEIRAATQLVCSVGIGPNKLVAKVASDAEKPAGFVVLTREQACARFAQAPPGLVPGIGPKTAARLAALGLTTLAAVGAAPERMLVERFGPNLGLELGRRARFEHDGVVGAERKVVSESRERTFDQDVRRSRPAARVAERDGRGAVREPRRSRAPRAHDRDQGPPRRLHDGHARAYSQRAHLRRRAGDGGGAAPARGVRARTAGAAARRAGRGVGLRRSRRCPHRRGGSRDTRISCCCRYRIDGCHSHASGRSSSATSARARGRHCC